MVVIMIMIMNMLVIMIMTRILIIIIIIIITIIIDIVIIIIIITIIINVIIIVMTTLMPNYEINMYHIAWTIQCNMLLILEPETIAPSVERRKHASTTSNQNIGRKKIVISEGHLCPLCIFDYSVLTALLFMVNIIGHGHGN